MTRITVDLHDDDYARLVRLAAALTRTHSAVVRSALHVVETLLEHSVLGPDGYLVLKKPGTGETKELVLIL